MRPITNYQKYEEILNKQVMQYLCGIKQDLLEEAL